MRLDTTGRRPDGNVVDELRYHNESTRNQTAKLVVSMSMYDETMGHSLHELIFDVDDCQLAASRMHLVLHRRESCCPKEIRSLRTLRGGLFSLRWLASSGAISGMGCEWL